jgi:hypothetical protein
MVRGAVADVALDRGKQAVTMAACAYIVTFKGTIEHLCAQICVDFVLRCKVTVILVEAPVGVVKGKGVGLAGCRIGDTSARVLHLNDALGSTLLFT